MAKPEDGLKLGVKIVGDRATLQAIHQLPKDVDKDFGKAMLDVSRMLAGKIRSAGERQGAQAALVAGTAKAKFGRSPGITVGGSTPLGRNATPAWQLLTGSEFGMTPGGKGKGSRDYSPHGFKPRHSPEGMWIYPTLAASQDEISRAAYEVAEDAVTKAGKTPPSPPAPPAGKAL